MGTKTRRGGYGFSARCHVVVTSPPLFPPNHHQPRCSLHSLHSPPPNPHHRRTTTATRGAPASAQDATSPRRTTSSMHRRGGRARHGTVSTDRHESTTTTSPRRTPPRRPRVVRGAPASAQGGHVTMPDNQQRAEERRTGQAWDSEHGPPRHHVAGKLPTPSNLPSTTTAPSQPPQTPTRWHTRHHPPQAAR